MASFKFQIGAFMVPFDLKSGYHLCEIHSSTKHFWASPGSFLTAMHGGILFLQFSNMVCPLSHIFSPSYCAHSLNTGGNTGGYVDDTIQYNTIKIYLNTVKSFSTKKTN